MYIYCDLRGGIKGAAHTLNRLLQAACRMAAILNVQYMQYKLYWTGIVSAAYAGKLVRIKACQNLKVPEHRIFSSIVLTGTRCVRIVRRAISRLHHIATLSYRGPWLVGVTIKHIMWVFIVLTAFEMWWHWSLASRIRHYSTRIRRLAPVGSFQQVTIKHMMCVL